MPSPNTTDTPEFIGRGLRVQTFKATGAVSPLYLVGTQAACAEYLNRIGGKTVFIEGDNGERIEIGIVTHTTMESMP